MAREPWEREVDVRTAQERARRNNSECATCGAWLDEDGTCPRCHQPKPNFSAKPAIKPARKPLSAFLPCCGAVRPASLRPEDPCPACGAN